MESKNIKAQLLIYGSAFSFVSALLLFFSLSDNDYSYYQFLRITVTITAIVVSVTAALHREPLVAVPSIFAIMLFNPVFVFSFDRSTWQFLDVLYGAYFLGVGLAFPYELYKSKQ